MKKSNYLLFLLLCGFVLLAPACSTRTSETSAPPDIPGEPPTAEPTPVPTVAPTAPPADTEEPQPGDATPEEEQTPEATIQGTLESGVPFGILEGGYPFKGNPEAPVIIVEFSDYQ